MATLGPSPAARCPACGAELTRHERYAGGHCGDWQCRLHREQARRRAALAERWVRLRDAAARDAAQPAAVRAPIVVVRRYARPLGPVPQPQIDELRQHLWSLREEAERMAAEPGLSNDRADEPPPMPADSPVGVLMARVCASCTGHCCRLGNGRKAFLDAQAMVAGLRAAPQTSYGELVDSYLAAVPAQHHVDSCVFHGAAGCVLPRERRALICNSYLCPALEQTHEHAIRGGVSQVFVVRHDSTSDESDGAFVPPLAGGH